MKWIKAMRLPAILFIIAFISVLPNISEASDAGRDDYLAGLTLEYRGEGAPDIKSAFIRYQAAAKAGSREALMALARLSDPNGVLKQTPEVWRDRLLDAAKAGWEEAAYTLAYALERGWVQGDGLRFEDFYYQAAMAGHPQSAKRLGEMYLLDSNSGRDESQGIMWLAMAAEKHEPGAALILGRHYYHKNSKAARHWLEKAEGAEAFHLLGELYLLEKRYVEAVNAFTVSADQNYAPAHLALGLINLENEFGFRANSREALKHFKVAAQDGLAEGAYQLGRMYLAGLATPKDQITGAFWLHRAGIGGHEQAMAEYNRVSYNFTAGQKKRLERMIADGQTPNSSEPAPKNIE